MPVLLLDTATAVLECEVDTPLCAGSGSDTAAVILHPWGRVGGCMWDPLVEALYTGAFRSGMFAHIVRYNMRGVGRSRGVRSSNQPDADDLVALCGSLLAGACPCSTLAGTSQQAAAPPPPPRRLVLVGYSYGSVAAARALARLPQVVAYASVAFPLGRLCRWLLGSADAWEHLSAARVPKLLLMGTADQFTTVSQLQAAVAHHDATPGTGPLQVVTLQGADHFPYARRELVIEQVISWLAQQLGAGTAPASTAPTGAASEPDGRGTAQP